MESFPRKAANDATPIRASLETWAKRSASKLRDADPEIPTGLSDRQEDVWTPLLALADLAGDPGRRNAIFSQTLNKPGLTPIGLRPPPIAPWTTRPQDKYPLSVESAPQ